MQPHCSCSAAQATMKRQVLVALFLALATTADASYVGADGRPVVDVTQGTIIGINETKGDVSFYSFKGIPFAEPPLDELRFMPAVQAGPWEGELNATSNPDRCPQFGLGSEDCLYLNVYTPEYAITSDLNGELPVMVWIYGGAWILGSIGGYDDVQDLVAKDVIVVLIQYRVGVMGFMSTGDEVAPGNQGLWDQNMGLRWVNSNIASFGGDPNRVTLFGESAGSASTNYHTLSPQSAGLFNQVILQSGNSFCPWAMGRDYHEVAVDIALNFDCPTNTSAAIIACLQGVNHRTLSLQLGHYDWNFSPIHIAPRVDGVFIIDEPAQLVKDNLYTKVPTMMGMTLDEGALISGEMYTIPGRIDELNSNFSLTGPTSLFLYPDEGWDTTAQTAYDRYIGHRSVAVPDADNLTLLLSHRLFHIPIDQFAQLQADTVTTYIYQLNYRGSASLLDIYERLGMNLTAAEEWVCHADDLPYLFDFYGEGDQHISERMVAMWTNFAKTGNPTPDDSLGIIWPAATSTNMHYMAIDDVLSIEPYSRMDDKAFWESLPLRINSILFS